MTSEPICKIETPQSRCRFALAWADITPPAGIYHRMWGAAKHDRATGVHRPLRATVAMFAAAGGGPVSAENAQALIALDHCTFGAVEHEQFVSRLAEATGLPKEMFLVVFSHTHGAGLMGLERTELPGGDLIPEYLRTMAERAGELVRECLGRLVPAGVVYGTGACDLAAHRDLFDPDRKEFVCGLNPGGPADPTVLVARMTGEGGEVLGTLVNYACHPTTLAWDNTLISPDYIGAMREVVERETGAPCLFLQGASGELGPREGFVGDPAVADRNGRQLGYAALSALTPLPPAGTRFRYAGPVVSGATLGVWVREPLGAEELERKGRWGIWRWRERLAYRPGRLTVEQVERDLQRSQAEEAAARDGGDEARASECRAMAERKRRLLHRLKELPEGDAFPLRVVLWRMGDAFWLGVQGESYSRLQTELRKRFKETPIVVASIAADWGASYLPPAELYGTGIYQESIAVVAPGSLERLIESVAERIERERKEDEDHED